MRAVVLVGGAGTRLRPLTHTVPKQLLPIVEVPMIERVLGHLAEHGVEEAVLSLGYLHHAFTDLFPEGHAGRVKLTYAVEPEPLDTAGAVAFAARTAGIVDRFLVANGDILTDLDITAMMAFHEQNDAEGTIALAEVPDPSAFGLVPTDDEGKVLAFVEKPPPGQAHTHTGTSMVNAGTYVLEPSVLDHIPAGRRVSIEREVFPLLATGGRLYGFPSKDYWTDTGTPVQYLQAQLDLISRPEGGPPVAGAESLGDRVWAVGHPLVDGSVRGPTLLGAGAHVEAGATVEHSVIGAGARVFPGARVAGSVLLPGVVVKAGAVVTGSILGAGAVVGEGATLIGLTVIGPNVEVAAGERLDGARLPDGE